MNQFVRNVATVATQEFRLRIRAGRWRWLLGAWFGVLTVFTVLLRLSLTAAGEDDRPLGTPMYGTLMLLVLGMALLVVPALTAQSVNGDRERGTLATLQVTLLRPVEIAVGKLVAAWGTALVFLALTAPLVAWTMVEGGVPLGRVAVTTLVAALLLGVVCAIAQALSALLARSTTSAVLSYLVVFALTVGTLIAFGLALSMTSERVSRTIEVPAAAALPPPGVSPPPGMPPFPTGEPEMIEETFEVTETRSDRVWWLLAPNPFVVLADTAPALPARRDPVTGRPAPSPLDPLGEIGRSVRQLRNPMPPWYSSTGYSAEFQEPLPASPVWPYGLTFNVLLGAAALAVTTWRLRTPARKLPRGIRVA